jgi:hypothetical protein
MLSSREDFLIATFRLHNAVNRRINKPVHQTVAACFEQLRNNVKTRSARDYRIAYINHIQRFWRTMQDSSGITSLKKINEMRKIEYEYFQRHDNNFETIISEHTVVLLSHSLDTQKSEPPRQLQIDTRVLPSIGFSGGRFQLRR